MQGVKGPDRRDLRSILLEAGQAYARGDLAGAERLAESVLRTWPSEPDACNILGIVAAACGDPMRAITLFETAAGNHPAPGPILSNLALTLGLLGRYEEAASRAHEAIRRQPGNAIDWITLSATQFALGKHRAARQAALAAICLDPRSSEAWNSLGNALIELGAYEVGRRAFLAAVHCDATRGDAWSGIGTVEMRHRRYEAAQSSFARALALRRQSPWWPVVGASIKPPTSSLTNTVKLRHDIEQFDYLLRQGVLEASFEPILAGFRSALSKFVVRHGVGGNAPLDPEDMRVIGAAYNRLIHWKPPPVSARGALASGWDRAKAQREYRDGAGICWVDGLLTAEALFELRRFCLEATVWSDVTHNFQSGSVARGYLGAYVADGFVAPLLFQIAEELTQALPEIFKEHPLHQLWAYKYEERLEGIDNHGDDAAINVNFWLTPDAANCDPSSGGLVVYRAAAPVDWDFAAINRDPAAISRFLETAGGDPVVVPYRQNRAVIFNSSLFHRTAPLNFRPGYENRRINVTMLFGYRR